MYGRAFLFVTLVVLGAVLPYLLADDVWMAGFKDAWRSIIDRSGSAGDVLSTAKPRAPSRVGVVPSPGGPARPGSHLPIQVSRATDSPAPRWFGPPGARLEQLLSFEITPEWVTNHWPRVTTRLSELDLNGWRVPIALGTQPQDLAGSITYYFDTQRRVQRIIVHGYLSDPAELVRLATTRYGMQRMPSPRGDLYAANIEGKTIGAMRLVHPPVVRADVPGQRCAVLLELNRAGTAYGMSREFQKIMPAAPESAANFSGGLRFPAS